MDGDDVEGRRREVQVREPSVLQVVEVALSQSVPAGVGAGGQDERRGEHNTTQPQRHLAPSRLITSHRLLLCLQNQF